MRTPMGLLVDYIQQNKENLTVDAIIAIALEMQGTYERDALIRMYVGYIDETVTDEQLKTAMEAGSLFYNLLWQQGHAFEEKVKEETPVEGQQETDQESRELGSSS